MIKQTLTKQVDKLTILMNRDGIEQVEQYKHKSRLPNVVGLMIFLCKRKKLLWNGNSKSNT